MTRVELFFALLVAAIWTAVQRYGVSALVTDRACKIKHAATGRATRAAKMHWIGAGHRLEGMHESASVLIARLRAERARVEDIAIGHRNAWIAIEHDKRYPLPA